MADSVSEAADHALRGMKEGFDSAEPTMWRAYDPSRVHLKGIGLDEGARPADADDPRPMAKRRYRVNEPTRLRWQPRVLQAWTVQV